VKELTLEITNYCERSCHWCSSYSSSMGIHVPLVTIQDQLKTYRQQCSTVRLSGGEPTTHPHFKKIVEYAADLDYEVQVLTAGFNSWIATRATYIVSMVDGESFDCLKSLLFFGVGVSMEIVATRGNEENLLKAVELSLHKGIPLHLLTLQKQGRAQYGSSPMKLLSWTGDKGCNKKNKITITSEGKVVTCSALKSGTCQVMEK
jgi:organic radical activating enzyme